MTAEQLLRAAEKKPDDVIYARCGFKLPLAARVQVLLTGDVRVQTKTGVDVVPDGMKFRLRTRPGEADLTTRWPWDRWLERRRARQGMEAPQELPRDNGLPTFRKLPADAALPPESRL